MNAGLLNPYSTPHQQKSLTQLRTYPGFTEEGSTQCMEDNIDTPCSLISSENSAQCEDNDCSPKWDTNVINERGKRGAFKFFNAFNNGYSGWMTTYGYNHYDGGSSYYASAYDSYNENKSWLTSSADRFFSHGLNFGISAQQTVLQDVINEARTALQKESCRNLFSEDVDPINLLNELASGNSSLGKIDMGNIGSNLNAQTGLALGSRIVTKADGTTIRQSLGYLPNTAHITLNTNIAAQTITRGRFGLTDIQNKALTLIHELGHAANNIYGSNSSRIMEDNATDKAILSRMNSYWVLNACFR
jgi:hypothetical protein